MSKNIRAYLNAVREAVGEEAELSEELSEELTVWLKWADAHAARLDPLQRRIAPKQ